MRNNYYRTRNQLFVVAPLVSALVLSLPALAQAPADAGSLLRQQEQLEQKLPQRFPDAEAPEIVRPALKEVAGVKLTVKAFRFSGALDLVSEAELQALLRDAIGQELDFTGLQQLADKVTEYLRRKGYLLARAYLPRQDVTAGIIEIALLKGRLEGAAGEPDGWQITLSKDARIDPARLAAIAETAAPSGSAVRQADLERALLLMNDLPGISVRSRLEPGSQSGTTRIAVNADEGPLVTGNVWADNYGNRSSGTEQINALLNLNDPGGRGDHASLSATASEGILLARLGYSMPLGSRGLRASVGYTDMRYETIEGAGVAAGLEGRSRIVQGGLAYPFIRSRSLNLHGSLGASHKALTDDSSAGTLRDKRIDSYTLGLNGDSLDTLGGGGLNAWNLGLTSGDLDLSRVPGDAASDAASLRTQGNYTKANLDLSRLQRLTGNWTLLGRLSGQWAGQNLDSSEQFILGGPAGVRAYPVGEAQGDAGWLASVELRHDLPNTPWGALQLSAFVDTGGIQLHETPGSVTIATATGKNRYQISGAGLGLSLGKTGSHSVRVAWAHALGNNPGRTTTGSNADGRHDNNQLWLQGVLWF